jgi:hypothetical protein
MAILGVLFDLDGPLLVDGKCTPRPGIPALIDELHERKIVVAAVSSSGSVAARLTQSKLKVDALYEAAQCGKKGSGNYIAAFCRDHRFQRHNCLTVWDDEYGFREGINGRTLGFHAEWGGGASRYGIRLERPSELIEYIDVFFRKTAPWFAQLDTRDQNGLDVSVRGLIDGNGAGSETIRQATLNTLKGRERIEIYGASFSLFLLTHMLSSAYLDGLLTSDRDQVLWQIYPGHAPSSKPPPIIQDSIEHLKLFRGRAGGSEYGLTRYTEATQSHAARIASRRSAVRFSNQMNSIILQRGTKVKGKRIYVIDDFTTEGYSLEAARQIFYAAGARSVHLLAFGKYGTRYHVEAPFDAQLVEPFQRKTYGDDQFVETVQRMTHSPEALKEFVESLDRLRDTTIKTKLLAASSPRIPPF